MMNTTYTPTARTFLSTLYGAARYGFRMQIRRLALWLAMILVALLMIGLMTRLPGFMDTLTHLANYPIVETVAYWANIINFLLPAVAALMLADRLIRDRRTHVDELLKTFPASRTAHLSGKYLGSTLATLTPMALIYLLGIIDILIQTHNLQVLAVALAAFAAIILPGMLFVGAFSLALPAIMWLPLYQFLFIGYWFWGNLYKVRNIPSISNTILTPVGGYASYGFFHVTVFPVPRGTTAQGIASIALLIGLSIVIILALSAYLKWKESRA